MIGILVLLCFFSPAILAFFLFKYYKNKAKTNAVSFYAPEEVRLVVHKLEGLPYFQHLSIGARKGFVKRTINLVERLDFIGVDGLYVSTEMKVLIAASAIQITFHKNDDPIWDFDTIFIYSGPFYVEQLQQELRGAVSPEGNIHLSWKNFKGGNNIPDDGINLGLHEMAHAVALSERTLRKGFYSLPMQHFFDVSADWMANPTPEMLSFFRSYGFTNAHEFFAVCVENFFERSQKFNDELPWIYKEMCDLLNQNPLNIKRDYMFDIEFYAN